jgi:hypothetical protein
MIDKPPIEMPPAGDEVQLIAEVVIKAGGVEGKEELDGSEREEDSPGDAVRHGGVYGIRSTHL